MLTISVSILVRILKSIPNEDGDIITKIYRGLDIIKYPMLNLVDIALIDFGLKLIIVEAQVFVQAKSADEVLERYKRAYYFQNSLIAAFVIFLIFYDLNNTFNMFNRQTPNWFRIASYSYIIQNILKIILYVWFWKLSFVFIDRLGVDKP